MMDFNKPDLERILRKRFSDFLRLDSSWRKALLRFFAELKNHSWDAFVFGGTVREILLNGASFEPRDLDIVVDEDSFNSIKRHFEEDIVRINSFGGLNIAYKGLAIDVWPVNQTWAFKSKYFDSADFKTLPKTTFLNLDGIAVEIFPKFKKSRRIYASGFFEAIEKQVLDINLEDNPYPSLCILRSIYYARKFSFSISYNLGMYIEYHGRSLDCVELVMKAQSKHFNRVIFTVSELSAILDLIKNSVYRKKGKPIEIFKKRHSQLELLLEGGVFLEGKEIEAAPADSKSLSSMQMDLFR